LSAWITITADNLNEYQAAKLIAAAREKALKAGQPDPFLAVMPDVINRMRDDIRGCKTNQVSATPLTVPPGLRGEAVLLTVEAMQSRLPGITIEDDLRILINDAKARVKRVSKCEIPIETPNDPLTPSDVQSGGFTETVQEGNSGNSREELNRL
jgi:hypothetical protein